MTNKQKQIFFSKMTNKKKTDEVYDFIGLLGSI